MNSNQINYFKKLSLYIRFLSLFFTLFPYPSFSDELFKFQQNLMGTVVEITIIAKDTGEAEKAAFRSFQEVRRIEYLMSPWIKGGDVFRINQSSGIKWVNVSPETLYIIKKSVEISERSAGGFDITVGPLVELWRRARAKGHPPSEEELKRNLDLVGFRNILISHEGKVFLKKEGMSIDLGGIAKGYAVDRAFEVLRRLGYRDLIVNAGGDLRVGGLKFGQPWSIGIQDPRNSEKIIAKISLAEGAIATSGDYEKYFEYQGKRYHHILNPKNGMPAEGCRSVSVKAKEAILADAMATAIFVLGPEKGYQLCQISKDLDCLIMDKEGKIIMTQAMHDILRYSN